MAPPVAVTSAGEEDLERGERRRERLTVLSWTKEGADGLAEWFLQLLEVQKGCLDNSTCQSGLEALTVPFTHKAEPLAGRLVWPDPPPSVVWLSLKLSQSVPF